MASVHPGLAAATAEIDSIKQLISDLEGGKSVKINDITQRLRSMAPRLKELSQTPECAQGQNAALLVELSSGVKQSLDRVRQLHAQMVSIAQQQHQQQHQQSQKQGPSARVAPAAPNVPSQASASTKTADYRRSVIGGSGMDNAHNRTLEPHSVETRRQSDGQKGSILSKVDEPVILEGWLKKQGEKGMIKSWKDRYFKQVGDKLYYYVNDLARDSQGYIPLSDVSAVKPTRVGFDLFTPSRIWHLQARTKAEEEKWIHGIRNWIKYSDVQQQLSDASNNATSTQEGERVTSVNQDKAHSQAHELPPPPEIMKSKSEQGPVPSITLSSQPKKSKFIQVGAVEEESTLEDLIEGKADRKMLCRSFDKVQHGNTAKQQPEMGKLSQKQHETPAKAGLRVDPAKPVTSNTGTPHEINQLKNQVKMLEQELEKAKSEAKEANSRCEAILLDKKGSENALYAAQLQLETIREQLIEILGQLRETKVQDDFDSISHVMSTVKSEAIGAMAKQRTLCNQLNKYKSGDTDDVDNLKQELFYNLAVALKLNLTLQGHSCSTGVASLYDKMRQKNVPYTQWNQWIYDEFLSNAARENKTAANQPQPTTPSFPSAIYKPSARSSGKTKTRREIEL